MSTATGRLEVIQTPEGRAYYPYGAWAPGYLVNAGTEHRLAAHLGRMPWAIAVFIVLPGLLRMGVVRLFHLPVPHVAADMGGAIAFLVFHYGRERHILRSCRRAAYRPTSRELLRLRLAKRGRTAIVAAHWALLIIFGAGTVMFAIMFDGLQRWLAVAAYAAAVILVAASLRRVERLSD